ncbi:hypothetical protein RSAG8_03516, partial [Rhizoctonia solani AG-8 WAC10335]
MWTDYNRETFHISQENTVCESPIQDFDNVLSSTGLAECPNCLEIDKKARKAKKRSRPIGYLVPAILFNQQPTNLGMGGRDWDISVDTRVDLLFIVGTTLSTKGTFELARNMAQVVQSNGGAVVYLDRALPNKKLLNLVDVHLRMDIEMFSMFVLEVKEGILLGDHKTYREQLSELCQRLTTNEVEEEVIPETSESNLISDEALQRNEYITDASFELLSSTIDYPTILEPEDDSITVLLLHSSSTATHAQTFARTFTEGVEFLGYECHLTIRCIGAFYDIAQLSIK